MSICRIQALSNLLNQLPLPLELTKQLEFDLEVRVRELQDMKLPCAKQKALHRKAVAVQKAIEDFVFYVDNYI